MGDRTWIGRRIREIAVELAPFLKERRKAKWRELEGYYRLNRDPVMEVTLPKLKFLEDEQT